MTSFSDYYRAGCKGHLIGVGGVSMSPLAEVLHGGGVTVTGSDMQDGATAAHLRDLGIPVTINTDNMVMADTTLDKEYEHCINEMGYDLKDIIRSNINSFRVSFAPEEYKEKMIKELEALL